MKKTAAILLILLIPTLLVFSATTADAPIAHYLLGSVRANASLAITLLEEVFPFDLDGKEVAYNASYESMIIGLRIGTYTLISNANSTNLYVAHSPLVLEGTDGSSANGKLRQIDYRLYVIYESGGSGFYSCRSDSSASTPKTATNNVTLSGILSLVNQSLYVSLDEGDETTTATAVDNLTGGTYKSNIYFMLEGE